jgi:hypothetical protein
MVPGWAIKVMGEINTRTVSDTRRAAIVNFLHVHIQPISNSYSDERIGLEVIEVTIIEGRPQ